VSEDPLDSVLLARIAHRYYIDGRTQEEIAREYALSRPRVQRLLAQAKRDGVVEIRIKVPPDLNLQLEQALRSTFDLKDAIVSASPPDPIERRAAVAQRAAEYLERRLSDGDIVAVGHGRDTGELPRSFRPERRLDCTFVSAMGGSPRSDAPTNPNEICRSLAERCGGRAVSLYAPAYVESAEVRDRLMAQEAIAETMGLAVKADLALVGIGGVDPDCTMVRSGCLSGEEIVSLRGRGAVGDVLGNYVDVHGRRIAAPHGDRLVALSLEELHRVDTVVAIASEAEKTAAILGILRTGVIDVLIVDESNAEAVLDLSRRGAHRSIGRPQPAEEVIGRR
jgi:DNA-binding transcriptional regulator LsrR (DeoR family)